MLGYSEPNNSETLLSELSLTSDKSMVCPCSPCKINDSQSVSMPICNANNLFRLCVSALPYTKSNSFFNCKLESRALSKLYPCPLHPRCVSPREKWYVINTTESRSFESAYFFHPSIACWKKGHPKWNIPPRFR